jgi:hypothetical protein
VATVTQLEATATDDALELLELLMATELAGRTRQEVGEVGVEWVSNGILVSEDSPDYQAVLGPRQIAKIPVTLNGAISATSCGAGWNGSGWIAATPSASASTPAAAAPAASAPAATPTAAPSMRPAFDCYANQNPNDGNAWATGASINIRPGTGNGYSQAVVKVTITDKYGHVLQTQTVTANSANNPTWQVVIDPEGGPSSLATESSCTATVESSS